MNCEEHTYSFIVEGPEIEELVSGEARYFPLIMFSLACFHTILFHRTLPTLDFRDGSVSYNSYLGTRDVDCEHLRLAYVCINSDQLTNKVSNPVRSFAESLRAEVSATGRETSGSIVLEFAVHRKGTWGLSSEPSVWERWTISLTVKSFTPEDREQHRLQLSEQVREQLLSMLEVVNSPNAYMPSLGSSQLETEHIIEFSIPNISPYRFSITYQSSPSQLRAGMGFAARRLLKYAQ
ncbi:hypothetical protein PHET_08855 [Paragonimus heterotremus]|uniref:Autophagy-related protein 101 n=1 Tax=Paragonimus heterotremus TaxID=100268 RepID=A0A8J4WUT7_9TREM|nr:hypothetical protein PHET_08855 [Paragonimus heterotremus]